MAGSTSLPRSCSQSSRGPGGSFDELAGVAVVIVIVVDVWAADERTQDARDDETGASGEHDEAYAAREAPSLDRPRQLR